MHKIPDTLGDVIKEARQNKSITIEALAEKLDIPSDTCIELKTNTKSPAMIYYFA